MPATDDDALKALLLAVSARDREAFRQLYALAAPKLFATALRILRHKPAAEEVLQDVFLRIWQNAGTYTRDTAPAGVWMNSIVRNRSIDVLRQRGSAPVASVNDGTDWFERIAEDRDRESDMIVVASLRRCLGTIDATARDCVLLAYYEGYSREELAQRFDRPVNTIKTWLHRSLGSLRACLDGSSS